MAPLEDKFARTIRYLRISVTDRCNLNCAYCKPDLNAPFFPSSEILSFEEICDVTEAAVGMGVDKVRLTGGEPLLRRQIVSLVSMLAKIPGIRDFAMTTNGVLLHDFAAPLAQAGLHRVNISLDATDPKRYAERTGGGHVGKVLAGITAAVEAGLTPVKINCVVNESKDEPDARDVAAFVAEHGLDARYIRRMNIAEGKYWPVDGGDGGRCPLCNRLRLTCDGFVRPCLLSDLAFSVRELGAAEALQQAVAEKPKSGKTSREHRLYRIGG